MRCAQCGADLVAGDRHCGRCGAPVPVAGEAEDDTIKLVKGVPVEPQAPSVYGPPIGQDTRMGVTEIMEVEGPEKRILGYRPFVPPPPPRRRAGCLRVVVIAAVVLLVALVATDVVTHGNVHFLGFGARPTMTATATRTAGACAVQPAKAAAAQALVRAQLTSGLRDEAKKDYRPVDNISAVRVGQKVYLTFQIATNKAGTVGVEFCTKSGKVEGTLAVPAKSNGRYAEFSAVFTSADVGASVATLTWDGAVAASKAFTIKQ
ncbi:MAG TPA: zinc ribbon domain-containing protein [Ktedonobacterales bacterium]